MKQFVGLINLMRPYQWSKNLFVFAPLLFTGEFTQREALIKSVSAFAVFCLASSAIYILNDLRDIDADRAHPKKSKSRPIAAGTVRPMNAIAVFVILLICIATWLYYAPELIPSILGYIALNIAYILYLKKQPVLDIFTIASGFVLRIFAGASALGVPVSSWMFVTGFSLALYIASMKRLSELKEVGTESREVLKIYSVELIEKFNILAAISTLTFYSLFALTTRQELIATIPIVLFGIMRYWYVADHLKAGESPSTALAKDPQLLIVGLVWILVVAWQLHTLNH